jgi:hypothetical protein
MDEAGLAAARRTAEWFIGDPNWANLIINAYLDPEAADRTLEMERNEDLHV